MDRLMCLAFRFTGSRRISEIIAELRVERRWRETTANHVAAGGIVATYHSTAGTQEFLI